MAGPCHSFLAVVCLLAPPTPLLAQEQDGRAERARQILSNQPRARDERDINDRARGWFGTWRLNLEKSVYQPGPAPYKRATMTVARVEGKVRFSYDFVHLRGGVQHLEWTGSFDGKDYIVQGADEYITYAYKQVRDRAYEIVAKTDGRVAAVAMVTLSSDGRTLTTVTRRKNSLGQNLTTTTVHERVH